ncbi:hypothetical protein G7046_g4780 [Stylonectria norvegica]|nr:hypothetical protein G7046_g4780 [Stylonectria norvegica]
MDWSLADGRMAQSSVGLLTVKTFAECERDVTWGGFLGQTRRDGEEATCGEASTVVPAEPRGARRVRERVGESGIIASVAPSPALGALNDERQIGSRGADPKVGWRTTLHFALALCTLHLSTMAIGNAGMDWKSPGGGNKAAASDAGIGKRRPVLNITGASQVQSDGGRLPFGLCPLPCGSRLATGDKRRRRLEKSKAPTALESPAGWARNLQDISGTGNKFFLSFFPFFPFFFACPLFQAGASSAGIAPNVNSPGAKLDVIQLPAPSRAPAISTQSPICPPGPFASFPGAAPLGFQWRWGGNGGTFMKGEDWR